MEQQNNISSKRSFFPETSVAFGILAFIPGVGLFFGVVAVIFGTIAIVKINKGVIGRKKLSYAGIVLGVVGAVFSVALYSLCIMAICTAGFLDISLSDLYLMIIGLWK